MKPIRFSLSALMMAALTAPAFATDLFDPAPPLQVSKWVKGKAVNLSEGKGKNVYVIEFWATWCGPCRKSIPHLTELQKKYKDKGVIFIGVSTDSEKTVKQVKPFVEDMGDKMGYTVAIDDDGATNKAYMEAFDVDGIPHAFVVDKEGRIVWHGHPSFPEDRMDEVLKLVVSGKWDKEAAEKEEQEADKKMKELEKKARAEQAKAREAYAKLQKESRDFLTALRKSESAAKDSSEQGEKLLKMIKDSPEMLPRHAMCNEIAWTILAINGVKYRDKELALKFAKAAYDVCEGQDAAIVDTYARALYDNGKKDEAIKIQKKAVELADKIEDGPQAARLKKELKEALAIYEKGGKPKFEDAQGANADNDEGDDDEDDDANDDSMNKDKKDAKKPEPKKKEKSKKDDDDDDDDDGR